MIDFGEVDFPEEKVSVFGIRNNKQSQPIFFEWIMTDSIAQQSEQIACYFLIFWLPAVQIYPRKGMIPATGYQRVELKFTPLPKAMMYRVHIKCRIAYTSTVST